MSKNKVNQVLLISLLTAFIATGCAGFAGKRLPVYSTDQVPAPEKKISATYDVKASGPFGDDSTLAEHFDNKIQKVLSSSPVFSELKSGYGTGDYHYSFVVRNEGAPSLPIVALNSFISGFTFTIIPAYVRDIYIVTIDVKQDDRVLKTYNYKDHMDFWIQLFLVFAMPTHWPSTVSDSVIDNIIMNFAHDFASDLQSGVYLARKIDQ